MMIEVAVLDKWPSPHQLMPFERRSRRRLGKTSSEAGSKPWLPRLHRRTIQRDTYCRALIDRANQLWQSSRSPVHEASALRLAFGAAVPPSSG